MEKRYDAIGIESPCFDFPLNMNALPRPNVGSRLNDYSWQGGGKVSTGMIAAARLGAKCCQIGAVGDDIFGRACLKDFQRHGVDTRYMYVRKGASTSLSVVISDLESGGRSISFMSGTAGGVSEEEIPFELFRETRFYYTAYLSDVSVKAARIAKEAGAQVLIDADGYSETTMAHLDLIDYFIGSEFFYEKLPAENGYEGNCRLLQSKGAGAVIFTLGEKGAVGVDEHGDYLELPADRVDVVDTLGCGDVYHGAFLAGLLQGWPTKQTARFAGAVASIKATRIGGRAGIPDMATALQFIETGEIDPAGLDRRVAEYRRGLEV